jgi:flagellar biosynthesis chaperone FliJ
MLRENTPTDNCVAERLVRTFKEHKIYTSTIEKKIASGMAISATFNSYRKYLNQYVKSLNNKPNNKSKER